MIPPMHTRMPTWRPRTRRFYASTARSHFCRRGWATRSCAAPATRRLTLDGDPGKARRWQFDLPGLEAIIEYGIWWDWEIQHLYELEAAWVYVGDGSVLRVEASWHGRFHEMLIEGKPPLRGQRPVLYSQPGKHAFAPEAGMVRAAGGVHRAVPGLLPAAWDSW